MAAAPLCVCRCNCLSFLGLLSIFLTSAQAACPSTPNQCGDCPSTISARFSPTASVQIVGSLNYRCTQAGMTALIRAGCTHGSCYSVHEFDVPFEYSDCAQSGSEECIAWRWLHCAFPDDMTSGNVMHAYFFVKGKYEGIGFDFAKKNVPALLSSNGASTLEDGCAATWVEASKVINLKFKAAEAKGLVLFGWDGCSCTGIAQARFNAADLCHEDLTWSNSHSDLIRYLQCKEGDDRHHSFVYFREGQNWKFVGNGFAFDVNRMSDNQLLGMASTANVATSCKSEFSINLYGMALSECRAAVTDSSGSWMWDGKCTEKGGGVHQICMDRLPADFSVKTGQGPWSEGRADMRHCVCIGAWSLYMTRQEDPNYKTSVAWPFCDAIPLSALTSRYIAKWKDWNGIPANIVHGAHQMLTKCLKHRSGPGSDPPSLREACHLGEAFLTLQSHESSLAQVKVQDLLKDAGFDCSAEEADMEGRQMELPGSPSSDPKAYGGSGGDMSKVGQPSSGAPTSQPSSGATRGGGSGASKPRTADASNSRAMGGLCLCTLLVLYSMW